MTIRKIACWRDGDKATVPTGFELCQFVPSGDRTTIYGFRGGVADATNTLGYDADPGDTTRDRSTGGGTYPLEITGLFWLPNTTRYFRVDLPSGAGTYDVRSWVSDTNGTATRSGNLQFEDGATNNVLYTSIKTSTTTPVADIDGTNSTAFASWSWSSSPSVQMTFTQDHVRIRSTGGTQYFDGFSFELASTPPAANFYNPFISKTFNNNYTRRIR